VRRLCFGEETRFERFLGYYVAAFTAQGYRFRDPDAYVTYGEPGRQIWRITVDEDTTVFMLVFAESDSHAAPVHDASRQQEVLTRLYAGGGWETDEMLHALQASTDLYFDRVSQIVMPSWTKGRVALIGDACACPSLLAGEGSAMAMAEAYTLAGELVVAQGRYASAFEIYERRLRPYVERNGAQVRCELRPQECVRAVAAKRDHQRREPPRAHSAAVQRPDAHGHRTAGLSVRLHRASQSPTAKTESASSQG
jgi:2-polyprenyl-6-methoxyphenol hydroxylase-like FAD-dependent oxidoreductase